MNPVWEHWECESIGGKGDKVDAYMCARCLCSQPLAFSSALAFRYCLDAQPLQDAAADEESVRCPPPPAPRTSARVAQ